MKVKTHQAALLGSVHFSGCILHADERLVIFKTTVVEMSLPLCERSRMLS